MRIRWAGYLGTSIPEKDTVGDFLVKSSERMYTQGSPQFYAVGTPLQVPIQNRIGGFSQQLQGLTPRFWNNDGAEYSTLKEIIRVG